MTAPPYSATVTAVGGRWWLRLTTRGGGLCARLGVGPDALSLPQACARCTGVLAIAGWRVVQWRRLHLDSATTTVREAR
jgi:hypothetical protein